MRGRYTARTHLTSASHILHNEACVITLHEELHHARGNDVQLTGDLIGSEEDVVRRNVDFVQQHADGIQEVAVAAVEDFHKPNQLPAHVLGNLNLHCRFFDEKSYVVVKM